MRRRRGRSGAGNSCMPRPALPWTQMTRAIGVHGCQQAARGVRAGSTATLLGPVGSVVLGGGIGTLSLAALRTRIPLPLAQRDRLDGNR